MFSLSIRFLLVALISSLHVSEYYASRIVVGSMPTDLTTADSQQSRHLMASASSACSKVKADNGPTAGVSIGNNVVKIAAGIAGAAPVPGLGGAVTFIGGQIMSTFFPYEAATPADTYNCMVAFVEEAVSKAVNTLENKLIQNDLNTILRNFREMNNRLTRAKELNITDPFTTITTEVNLLNQALKDAVYKIISADDKAANLVPLYLLVTTQVLPFANFLYENYEAIYKSESKEEILLYKPQIKTDVDLIMTQIDANFFKFKDAAVLSRTKQIQNFTKKLCKGMQEDMDVMTDVSWIPGYAQPVSGSTVCQFNDPGANSDGERCDTLPAGFFFENDLDQLPKGRGWVEQFPLALYNLFGRILRTESPWIYGRDAAMDAMEMMKRNAEIIASINVEVATAGSALWRAMLPGQVIRPKFSQQLVSKSTFPFGPAEFYCYLGKTNPNDPIDKCAPQLNTVSYRTTADKAKMGIRPRKTDLDSKDWAMVRDTFIQTPRPRNGFNITKIEIASGAWIDGITVGISGSSDTRLGAMNRGTKRTIDTDNGKNPIVRVDIYARKSYHGIGRITGLKFFQKRSPQVGIMTGKNEGCGSEDNGFLGSYHYEFDFTQWDGQVWLCGLDMFSTDSSTRVEAVAPRWCYNQFVLSS